MKRVRDYTLFPVSLIFLAFCVSVPGWAQTVVTYPAPEGEAVTDGYTVSVNGQPVDVYSAQSEFFDGDYYFAYFDFSGTVDIEIKSVFPMSQTQILPNRFGFQPDVKDDSVTFKADQPFRISVEPNGRIKPLLLFGNEMETDIPDAGDPNVLYFGPGVHRPGKIDVTSNKTVYIAGGAVVKGCIYAHGENITVRGRGILGGEESPRFKGPGPYLLTYSAVRQGEIRDIIIRNPWSWTAVVYDGSDVVIDGLKICGTRMLNDDALDLVNSFNIVVRNCFFRTQDDSIAIKGISATKTSCENIFIENCQFWTDVANIYRIGYECDANTMRNIVSRHIDVLHYSKNFRAPTEYWANAIFWLQPSLNMLIEDCHFEDITVYSDGSDILMLMAKPMGCKYGNHTEPEPGTLRNCSFKNIQVIGTSGNFNGLLYMLGSDSEHHVDGLTFENVRYFGDQITKDSQCVEIGDYVDNIEFK